MERITDVNTDCSEQVFSWFRKYDITLNEMKFNHHYFLVLLHCRMHNEALKIGEANYLNKYSYNNMGPSNKTRYIGTTMNECSKPEDKSNYFHDSLYIIY